ncbi:MAG TPA: saccharopine dehydrogenase NADP-binding domain-containing protein, partial [Acidimicrobiales bacterium]|nr:saccharopine dehydrogenase NADP-binding domain-containing protein [Acidimicrobiales bacterium]
MGAGGVGTAVVRTVARRKLFEHVVVADYDAVRAESAISGNGARFSAVQVDATDEASLVGLIGSQRIDAVLNAVDPRFVMPIFRASLAAGVTYLDLAMSLSRPNA